MENIDHTIQTDSENAEHPLLRGINNRDITGVKTEGTTIKLLLLLVQNPAGLTLKEMSVLTGVGENTIHTALRTLMVYAKGEFDAFGYRVIISKQGKVGTYRLEQTGEENLNPMRITEAMRLRTQNLLNTVLGAERKLERKVRVLSAPHKNAEAQLHNSTWAMHPESFKYYCAEKAIEAAVEGRWLTLESLRRGLPDPSIRSQFFCHLEATSFTFAPELGFVLRSLTELPERGRMGAFFLDPDDRLQACGDLYPNDLEGTKDLTYFDKVRHFTFEEFEKRFSRVKKRRKDLNFRERDEKVISFIANAQKEGKHFSIPQMSKVLGIEEGNIQAAVIKSVQNRADWGFFLRARPKSGFECVLYQGYQD